MSLLFSSLRTAITLSFSHLYPYKTTNSCAKLKHSIAGKSIINNNKYDYYITILFLVGL